MIYKDMTTEAAARYNFRIYRLVRILHNLKVINDMELIRHEETIYERLPIGIDVDWYNYRLRHGHGDFIQF